MGLLSFLKGGEVAAANSDLDALSKGTNDIKKISKAFKERNPRYNNKQVTLIVHNWEETRDSNTSKD